jgi:hypothetical protein
MTKAGRPRKDGPRYHSGKLKPQPLPDLQRLRHAIWKLAKDENLESVVGQLFFQGRIDVPQTKAARRFLADRVAADHALGLPSRMARGQDLTAVQGRPIDNEDEVTIRRRRRAIAVYDEAEAAIGLGSLELAAVQWIVIYDKLPDGYEQFLRLRDGLSRLAVYYAKRGVDGFR